MSYYLDVAKRLDESGEKEGAAVIRELYGHKAELEALVKRVSDARDLLIKDQKT